MPGRVPSASASGHLRGGEVPVHEVPEGLEVLRPRIAVVDVIGVLPDVAGEQRLVGAGQRRRRVLGADQAEAAVRALYQPGPARAEGADRGLGELFLEGGEAAEGLGDAVAELALRLAAALGLQAVPVEAVVPD